MQRPLVGIVGLGLVGQALGARLRGAGWHTLGWDLREAAREAFALAGGEAAASLPALGARCEQVLLAVYDTAGVVQLCEGGGSDEGAGGATLRAPGHRVRTLLDCSTGDPDALQALAGRLRARGVALVECPLSGSSQQIEAGEATALVAGEPADLAACDSLLAAVANRRIHVGGAGAAARAKLATNLVLGLNRAALAQGMAFAQALGIAPAAFLELVCATPARSDAALVKGPLMVAHDFQPRSRVRQHLKDLDLMLAAAARAGLDMPLVALHAQLLREAVAAGQGELDNAAILLRLLDRRPGTSGTAGAADEPTEPPTAQGSGDA